MKKNIRKTRTIKFMWKSDNFFHEDFIKQFIESLLKYTDINGISKVEIADDLLHNEKDKHDCKGIFTFSIRVYNQFESSNAKVRFYLKHHHIVTEFIPNFNTEETYVSICDFLNKVTADNNIHRVFDRDKENKIQLELIMQKDIKKVDKSLFMWETKRLSNENFVRNFIQDIVVTEEYLEPNGICQVTLLSGLSRKKGNTYIFSIQLHNHLQSIDTNINFYLKDKHIIAQFYLDVDMVDHFLSVFDFFDNLENDHDLCMVVDDAKRDKIELELMS